MPDLASLAAGLREHNRVKELKRCQEDAWYLATEYLGYKWNEQAQPESEFPGKGFTEELHRNVFRWYDLWRAEQTRGIWKPRFHHKTTMVVVWIIQEILRDPYTYLFYFHAVDEEAEKVVSEVVNHVQRNKKLRSLDPIGEDEDGKPYRAFPAQNAKKFASSDRFTLRRPSHKFSRFPTLLGKGAGSEIVGAHAKKAFLDDIIGLRTIKNNAFADVKTWFQSIVVPVVDGAWYCVTGTRWHTLAIYEEWIKSADWPTIVIPSTVAEKDDFLEDPSRVDWTKKKIELGIDDTLSRPVFGPLSYRPTAKKMIAFYHREMQADFQPQMQNNPSPPGEKPWGPEACEHFITKKEALAGPGLVVVLSDPAPAKTGSLDGRGAKTRGDGTKDDWAHAVLKMRKKGQRRELILLDGRASKEWDVDQGFDELCNLKRRWRASHHAVESTGQAIALYEKSHREAARRGGVKFSPITMSGTYRGQAKNVYFAALASRARGDEFLICNETCDPVFLETFLEQARGWRPNESGGNGLRYDDVANVVSFSTDPAFETYMPQALEDEEEWSPYRRPKGDGDFQYQGKYIRW